MEKDYHLSNSKTDEAEHLESAAPQLQLHQNNTDNEAYKSYHGEGKVKEVANAALAKALSEETIPKFSRESLHLYLMCFTTFLCAIANGYDGSLMTGLIAMEQFQNVFHSGTTGSTVSVIFSMYTVGSMVAAPFAAIISDRFGRRKGMFAGAAVIIIGAVIATTSKHIAQIVVARLILGAGVQICTVSAPAYCIEVSPPHMRGKMTGIYNCGYFGGAIPAAAITFGTSYIQSNLAWQLPLIFQCFAAIFVMIFVFFIPDSPRWLMSQGRTEEAHAFLVKYHGNNNPQSALVKLELEEMMEGIRQDGIDKVWWDYRPLFLSHNGRWRMAQVLMISIFGQFSGNGLGSFNTVIYNNLGYTKVATQLALNLANSVCSAIGAVTAAFLTDRMPRRKVLVPGTFACAVFLAINAGLSAALAKDTTNVKLSQGALAAYYFFNIIFSFTYTPLQGVIPAEALETTMRAKGLALSGVLVSAVGFINQFAGPIALGNIGYKYTYIFVGWDCVETAAWYFFGVESQGRTLEQLEWVYNQKNPVKASLKADKVAVAADGHILEEL